eukprot:TRINITY_DN10209_c0_g1_i1.p1 TRINITY_DN10209_c0_g1~~TRINITY_DN10209_c0_g1_i1.p1  ORF type:complete len:310 (-),score=38.39 TRINITY_DN10209_c0_g1_i1:154-1083(-)
MRMKFPNLISLSIASSAPIMLFPDKAPPELAYQIATSNYNYSTKVPNCVSLIYQGFSELERIKTTMGAIDLQNVNRAFNICTGEEVKDLQGILKVEDWLTTAYSIMAMIDYPYETNFLAHIPGWPCNKSCEAFINATNNTLSILSSMYQSALVYYNYYNEKTCLNISAIKLHNGWGMDSVSMWPLACTSCPFDEQANFNQKDFFPSTVWNQNQFTNLCESTFGLRPLFYQALDYFGGWTNDELAQYSKIFFVNGKLDPWSSGGVLTNISETVKAVYMESSAHHLDLRLPNDLDPDSVKQGRQMLSLIHI